MGRGIRGVVVALAAVAALATPGLTAEASQPSGCPSGWVALTFDDGPRSENSDRAMDILASRNAGATFFVIGRRVQTFPDIARRMMGEGHTVANHTWSHPRLPNLSDAEIRDQLWLTERALLDAGVHRMPLLRAPGFAMDARVRRVVEGQGYRIVDRTINPQDWQGHSPSYIRDFVLQRLHPGAIIVLHEAVDNTLAALPGMIDGIHSRGYCTGVVNERGHIAPRGSVPRSSGVFWDTAGNTFEGDIERVAAHHITRGCNPPTNSRYCPGSTTTRAQTASFLVRAMGLTPLDSSRFVDTRNSTHRRDIEAIAAADITRGCNPPTNDRFCPSQRVTRGQMSAFIARGLDLPRTRTTFRDSRTHLFDLDIGALEQAGITRGCNPPINDRYCPDDPMTRGQMAAFLNRALGLR